MAGVVPGSGQSVSAAENGLIEYEYEYEYEYEQGSSPMSLKSNVSGSGVGKAITLVSCTFVLGRSLGFAKEILTQRRKARQANTKQAFASK